MLFRSPFGTLVEIADFKPVTSLGYRLAVVDMDRGEEILYLGFANECSNLEEDERCFCSCNNVIINSVIQYHLSQDVARRCGRHHHQRQVGRFFG